MLTPKQREQRRIARHIFSRARTQGRIRPMPDNCERCGRHIDTLTPTRLEAHHPDYSKPLEIRWLCRLCHGVEHAQMRAFPPILDDVLMPSGEKFTLAQVRGMKGITQAELARRSGMAQGHISALEREPSRWVQIPTMEKLEKGLNMTALLSVSGLVFEERGE